jgi:hypothetical protein
MTTYYIKIAIELHTYKIFLNKYFLGYSGVTEANQEYGLIIVMRNFLNMCF